MKNIKSLTNPCIFRKTQIMGFSILAYFLFISFLAPFLLLHFDSYYYWDWSRHLDLSYYDGPPIIAYLIYISTNLFGHSMGAMSAVGITCTALTAVIIYKTARCLFDEEASFAATLLWLFSPITTLDILKQVTYDTPLTLFWALTCYAVLKFIQNNSYRFLYFAGFSAGMMLLSKYTGIVLIIALFIFTLITSYRRLFLSIHLYLAGLLSLILFSPVLYWNYQHDWVSFLYQLNIHKEFDKHNILYNIFMFCIRELIPILNIMLFVPFIYWSEFKRYKADIRILFLLVISIVFIIFYIFLASYAHIRSMWLSQYWISACILAGMLYQKKKYQSLVQFFIIAFSICSMGIMLSNTTVFNMHHSEKFEYYKNIQRINKLLPKIPVVVSSSWANARMLFFVKDYPLIYVFNSSNTQTLLKYENQQNQYQFWENEYLQYRIQHASQPILYLDRVDNKQYIEKYFTECKQIEQFKEFSTADLGKLYAYWCH